MDPIPIPFGGPHNASRFPRASSQRSVNMYPKAENGKTDIVMYRDPGRRKILTIGDGPCRSNGVSFGGNQYWISGNDLVQITPSLTGSVVGSINTAIGRVSMVAGRNELLFTDGTDGWTWDGSTLTQITGQPNFAANPAYVAELGGYGIMFATGTEALRSSDLNALDTWSTATDFASAEIASDDLCAIISNDDNLYALGEKSLEVYANQGAIQGFPFTRYQGSTIRWGCVAAFSLAASPAGVFFLGGTEKGDLSVLQVDGLTAQVISDENLSFEISRFSARSDAFGFVYQQSGQWWYQLTFPTAERTYVYSIASQRWHERRTYPAMADRAGGHGFFAESGTHIIGDSATADFYALDFGVYTDHDQPMECLLTSPPIQVNRQSLICHAITLDVEHGQSADSQLLPEIGLRFSDDGANTWSDWIFEPLGAMGEYGKQVTFNRLGQFRERIFQLRVTHAVDWALYGAFGRFTKARS